MYISWFLKTFSYLQPDSADSKKIIIANAELCEISIYYLQQGWIDVGVDESCQTFLLSLCGLLPFLLALSQSSSSL